MIYEIEDLLTISQCASANIDGKWVPARPERHSLAVRIKAAWLVLTDKADAVKWPLGQ